jgi:hypothetical protein
MAFFPPFDVFAFAVLRPDSASEAVAGAAAAFGDEDAGRFEGRVGFGAGAVGLSASVAASAAARSAARAASLGLAGASGELRGAFGDDLTAPTVGAGASVASH